MIFTRNHFTIPVLILFTSFAFAQEAPNSYIIGIGDVFVGPGDAVDAKTTSGAVLSTTKVLLLWFPTVFVALSCPVMVMVARPSLAAGMSAV